ncbi:PLD nuclease N-terminal domain-containing protein [Streptomyces chattanoogensis]|uniref:Cardiolipin synthase N-terminal domain-containing protein n=1 Tax=Streptomyces chattanoogensis TaxID=66876 RepID=A0A0N0H1K0_9ACTN|nr:PLD nuclease N-terminal domain-containing protein [Streptomyces chattanoogensis]KPC64310.1 hypothetical protein ADL29_12370 [Streptomyces chattanoogensis]
MPAHQISLAISSNPYLMGSAAVALILTAAYVAVIVSAVVSISTSHLSTGTKLVWIVFAFMAPFLGSVLWFLIGRRDARRTPATR